MNTSHYPPPVDKLLTLGDARNMTRWPDYLALGLGPEHILDLIRMATDEGLNMADSKSSQVWAPLHAWRALGQLRAESAIEPLLGLLRRIDDDQDDWVGREIPQVMGMIGPAAIPALAASVSDSSRGLWARVTAATGLTEIGQRHPSARAECVDTLTRLLERFQDHDKVLNADLIAGLLELHAVESAPVMERAFAAGCVDNAVSGDWEDVQIELGLAHERTTPHPKYIAESLGPEMSAKIAQVSRQIQAVEPPDQSRRTKAKKRDKRKQQEPRRKKNKS